MTTVLYINERPREASSSGAEQEYTRVWDIEMSDGLGTATHCIAASGVSFGNAHPEYGAAFAYRARASQTDEVRFWVLTIDYKTFGFTAEEQEAWTQPNPTLRTPRVTGAWEMVSVAAPTDRNGAVIKNSAGQVPDPRPTADAYLSGYHITDYVSEIPDWYDSYRGRYGTCNDNPFRIQLQNGQYKEVEKGCASLRDARHSEYRIENGYGFFELSLTLLLRDPPESDTGQEGWVFDMVDMGKMAYMEDPDPEIGIVLTLQPILGQDGQPVSEPVLLDGNGNVLADPTYETPVILYWDILAPRDYSILPACSPV